MGPTPQPLLRVLGPFDLHVAGRETPRLPRKVQSLLTVLAIQAGQPIAREAVADMLWTDSEPDQARGSLRQALLILRRMLGPDLIKAEAGMLVLAQGLMAVDVLDFQRGAASTDANELAHCADLYRGELLQGVRPVSARFDEWLASERARLAALAAEVLRRLAASRASAGNPDAALAAALRLVALDELREDAHRLVMQLLAQAGRRAEALRHFDGCAEILRRDLDIGPDAETVALSEQIRAQERVPTLAQVRGPAPYRPATLSVGSPGESCSAEPGGDPAAAGSVTAPRVSLADRFGRRLAWAIAAACLVAAVALPIRTPDRLPSVAVLSFTDLTGDPLFQDTAAGFADVVKDDLAERHGLRSLLVETADDDVPAARRRLHADTSIRYFLEGTADFGARGHVAISAKLSDAKGSELWSGRYDDGASAVLRISDDIATHVARAIGGVVVADNRPAPASSFGKQQEIRDLLSLARFVDYRVSRDADPVAGSLYRRVLSFDPNNGMALASLARILINDALYGWSPGGGGYVEAEAILGRALALSPTNVLALWDICYLRRLQNRLAEAIEICKRVLDINPGFASAMRELGHDLLEAGHAEEAITWYRAAVQASPNHPYVWNAYLGMGVAELALGHPEDAVSAIRRADEAGGKEDYWACLWLAAALEMSGHHAEAAQVMVESRPLRPANMVIGTDRLGLLGGSQYSAQRQQAFDAMRRAGL